PPTRLSKRAAAKESRERAVKRVYEEAKKAQREAKKQRKLGDGESESDESEDDEEQEEDASTAGPRDLFAEGDSDDETSAKGKAGKSEFEIQQGNLRKRIEKMEDEIIEKKEWTMKGEVTSKARPLNSLLEEDLTFDYVQKPTPQVTQESTETLEAMIKRRILEESWDDVERKREVEPKVFKPSERVDLDDSKPQQSLAEAYESEYLKQQAGDSYVHPSDEKLDKQHQEIDAMFRTLCVKLDALSNFHFTPKPAQPDVVIRAEAPAIEMEEVVPVNQSTALQLAPEEIYEKPVESGYTGDVKGKSERDATDRRRIKAKRKQEFKKKQKEKEATRKAKESVSSSIKVQSS
ncbi:U3 snoRNP protein, partial [Spiromyces aspiralis]